MMTNREQIEQAIISAGAFNGNDTETLLGEFGNVCEKADMWDEVKDDYLTSIRSAIDTTLYYTYPGAPAQEDMGAISSLLEQLLNDLERGE